MTNQGKKLQEIAASQGLNAYDLAKLVGKSRQTVEYHFKREEIKPDILAIYAKALNVKIADFSKESVVEEKKPTLSGGLVTVEKVMELMEENRKLWSVIARHGISVNFNAGVSVSGSALRINRNIFFEKRVQKRIHP